MHGPYIEMYRVCMCEHLGPIKNNIEVHPIPKHSRGLNTLLSELYILFKFIPTYLHKVSRACSVKQIQS